jgi:hypothetical protein
MLRRGDATRQAARTQLQRPPRAECLLTPVPAHRQSSVRSRWPLKCESCATSGASSPLPGAGSTWTATVPTAATASASAATPGARVSARREWQGRAGQG